MTATIHQELDAREMAQTGHTALEIADCLGIDIAWLTEHWAVLTTKAPPQRKPKWVSAGERKRRHGWATRR